MAINKLISTTLLIPFIFLSALSFAETKEELNDRVDDLDNQTTISLEKRIDYIDNWTRSNINSLYKDAKYLREYLQDQARSNYQILNEIISRKDAEQNTEVTKQISDTRIELAEQFNNKLWVILGIIIAVSSLIIGIFAIFSPFIFKRIENFLTKRLTKLSHEYVSIKIAEKNAWNYHNDALGYYYQYLHEKKKTEPDSGILELFTTRAIYIEIKAKEESDLLSDTPKDNNLKALINNNLCCYYLLSKDDKYQSEASTCADVAYKQSMSEDPNTPWYRWRETKVKTMLRWGDDNEKQNAREILSITLSNQSISDISWKKEQYEFYKDRMPGLKPPEEPPTG